MTTEKFDLTGEIIRIVTIEADSIVEFSDEETVLKGNATLSATGIGIFLVDCLQLMLNFTVSSYTFVEDFFNQRGYLMNGINSTSNTSHENNESIFSLFQSNQSDLALGYLYFIISRLEVAHVLLPLSNERFYLFFRQPKSSLDNPFTRQFSWGLAAIYLVILFLSASILALYETISSSLESKAEQKHISSNWNHQFWKFNYDTTFEAIGKWCQKSTGLVTSDKWQIKTLNNLLNFLSFILYIFYCAIILAALTKNVAPVREINHLFQHQYTFFAFGDTKDRLSRGIGLHKFWKPPHPTLPSKVEIDDMQEYENRLSIYELGENRHAHLDTPDNFFPSLDYVLNFYFNGSNSIKSKNICGRLSALPVKGGGFQSGLYVRKGFKFRNEFNYGLAKIRETGINHRLLHTYENTRFQNIGCQFSIKRAAYQDNLGMKYLGSLFIGLAVYCFIAVNILFVEFLLFKKNLW